MISYVVGDATQPRIGGTRVICHVCNDRGAWGRGFVLAVSRRWPVAERVYRTKRPPLGCVQLIEVESEADIIVANMIAQEGFASSDRPCALNYHALERCLETLSYMAVAGWSFHMPRIGCGLAGGDWASVAMLIEHWLGAFPVTVYDLEDPKCALH